MNEQEQEQDIQAAAETYPLDDAAIEIIAELNQQAAASNAALQGVLSLFARQQKLQGKWQLAPNGRELVKAP